MLNSREIRSDYLYDNSEQLKMVMPRGENIVFIANYIFANPCVIANKCRRALLQWRGFKQCDESRGQYASYFYDYYATKYQHSKRWGFIRDRRGNKRMVLKTAGLLLIDDDLQKRLKQWDQTPRETLSQIN